MLVATYILNGTMISRTPSPKENDSYEIRETELKEKDLITIDSEEDNLHELVGGEDGCTFIDILFPDYDDFDRIFRMYDLVQQ